MGKNVSELIYAASASEGERSSRLAEEAARRIEDDIASSGFLPGCSLGSLRVLSERYRVGRAVIREALGLLERRGLGKMRPGPCGGFILTKPRCDWMARELARYFRTSGITLRQLLDAREAVDQMVAQMALAQASREPALVLLVECLSQLTLDFAPAEDARSVGPEARSAMLEEKPASLAGVVAGRLAAQIVSGGNAGTRLGSEWDLCERFGVSRLTLRRAIRLLQDGGLVECRRGRGTGLIARERLAPGTIRLLLAYFISEKLDPMVAGTMLLQLNCFTPALAVSRAGADEKHKLEAALEKIESDESVDRCDLLRLVQRVSRLADSPIIDLVSRSLAAYEARFRAILPERLPAAVHASYFQLLRRLLERRAGGEASECEASELEWAKRESAQLLVEMSLTRPI
jgi:DNA-binding FadR family transcriptional regulator